MSEDDLDPEFRETFADKLSTELRGFGYWAWKPQIIRQVLDRLDEGDQLLYADAGCHLNARGRRRLARYFSLLSDDYPLVGFVPNAEKPRTLRGAPKPSVFPIADWTKGDLLVAFGVRDRPEILSAEQVCATAFLMQKCDPIERFLDAWQEPFRRDWRLVDDSPSQSPNCESFQEHRHDQSVFGLLAHAFPKRAVPFREIFPRSHSSGVPDWDRLKRFPIQARRDRGTDSSIVHESHSRSYGISIRGLFRGRFGLPF